MTTGGSVDGMTDDETGQNPAEASGSSGTLDIAGSGGFTKAASQAAAAQAIAIEALSAEEMTFGEFGNGDPERLTEILEAMDHGTVACLPGAYVPMDMITQLYHQF